MLLTSILVFGYCLVEAVAKPPFNFRDFCHIKHMGNSYTAECTGTSAYITDKDLFINGRSTTGLTEMSLTSFNSITITTETDIEKIIIKNTKNVVLVLSGSKLKNVLMDSIDELTLVSYYQSLGDMDSLELANIGKLNLNKTQQLTWPIKLINITNLEDMDLGFSSLKMTANKILIVGTNIQIIKTSTLTLIAESARVERSVLYIQENGVLTVSVNRFELSDSKIDLERGVIRLINSPGSVFSNNSFYGLDKQSLLISDQSDVAFVQNEIFNRDLSDLLSLNMKRVMFSKNNFGCTWCALKGSLLALDLHDTGNENFCYTNCNLTLNRFKDILNSGLLCNKGESEVSHDDLCSMKDVEIYPSEAVTFSDLLPYVLGVAITLFLLALLVFCICGKNSRQRFRRMMETNSLPQEMEVGSSQSKTVVFRKDPNVDDNHIYETVERHPRTNGRTTYCK